jgi:glycosyltransferase involved in cell wall biosynthesis
MHVLFVNSIRMWGGAEVWLMDIMSGLQSHGHEVTLVCRRDTILEKNARAHRFDVIAMPMRSDFDPLVVLSMLRLIKRRHIDIVCTNMDKEMRFAGLAARLARHVAVVPSREADYPIKNKLRYRLAYRKLSDRVMTNSESTRRTFLASAPWMSPQRVEVVYKGIDPAPYLVNSDDGVALRRELGIDEHDPMVGFVGQIIERKGIPDIIESIPLVARHIPNVRFLFAGEGKLAPFLLERARELKIEAHVIYAGFRSDVVRVMKAIDVLVLASVTEGFGYVLVEAMAAAKPVVATRVSSIPEIVHDGETGLLVDVHRPDQLAASLVAILKDPLLAAQMGQRGRQVVLDNFTLERMLDRTEAVFAGRVRARRGLRTTQISNLANPRPRT